MTLNDGLLLHFEPSITGDESDITGLKALTLHGSPLPVLVDDTDGPGNGTKAYEFNETVGQFIRIPTPKISPSSGTHAVWVKYSSASSRCLAMRYPSTSARGMQHGWDSGENTYTAYVGTAIAAKLLYQPPPVTFDGSWNLLCCTYETNSVIAYLNGTQVDTAAVTPTWNNVDSGSIGAGSEIGTSMAGRVDGVRMYDRVLSAAEITELWELGRGLPSGGPPQVHPLSGFGHPLGRPRTGQSQTFHPLSEG